MDIFKWMQMPEAKNQSTAAQTRASAIFTKQFPNVDKSKFIAQVDFDKKCNASAEIFFKEGPGSLKSVFGSDRKYWREEMKHAWFDGCGRVSLSIVAMQNQKALPILGIGFAETAPSLKKILNNEIKISVTPDEYFTTKF